VKFAKGKSSATIIGTIGKNQTKCFVLSASEGQILVAKLRSKNGQVQFVEQVVGIVFSTTPQRGDNEVCIEHFEVKKATTFTLTISIK
jgi:hypothetical protein